ncbi:hypothetical protein BBI10_02055 [Pseudomonas graminis]|uniref:Uncharacterized protein n=1 Tax=Pseudomonas graminis TaxID=158627 RepID=A0A1C2EEU6_9PSED|nr:hypothetical protein BBI10_02055 [Pseudomonas graminis]
MAWFWQKKPMSPEDRQVRDSILALKTLKCRDGRVSIDPYEVLGRPGYLEARRRAADLVHGLPPRPAALATAADWALVDTVGMDIFVSKLSQSLEQSRGQGLSLSEALSQLKCVPNELSA